MIIGSRRRGARRALQHDAVHVELGGLFAGIVILVMPMILLYLWAGRRIVQAMTQGALK